MLGNRPYSVAADATGKAAVTFGSTSRNRDWTVQQVSVQMPNAPIGCVCQLTHNGTFVTFLIPTGDVADGNPPIFLRGHSDTLTVTWTGATPGAVGTVLVYYDEEAS